MPWFVSSGEYTTQLFSAIASLNICLLCARGSSWPLYSSDIWELSLRKYHCWKLSSAISSSLVLFYCLKTHPCSSPPPSPTASSWISNMYTWVYLGDLEENVHLVASSGMFFPILLIFMALCHVVVSCSSTSPDVFHNGSGPKLSSWLNLLSSGTSPGLSYWILQQNSARNHQFTGTSWKKGSFEMSYTVLGGRRKSREWFIAPHQLCKHFVLLQAGVVINRLPSSVLTARQEQSPSQRVFLHAWICLFHLTPSHLLSQELLKTLVGEHLSEAGCPVWTWDPPCSVPPALGWQFAILAWVPEWVFCFWKRFFEFKT